MPRCAVYTRKSTDNGLEQSFNSLDAQREAAESYIKSQKEEGWVLVETRYDDGAYSGASLVRPALQRLLEDIKEDTIDVVVVYKVDRLTRSLSDFARLVDLFEDHKVSFVSVTQQFNTTSSMGRLTLNVLLSFAQFEREVIGERIRDKIAASKAKGIWMGGPVPLGYDLKDRTLIVNEKEAQTVRKIYRLYLETGTVRKLKQTLDHQGYTTKRRLQNNGKRTGGTPFSRGHLYRLLSNPLYRGRLVHKDKTYKGQHEAVVSEELWQRVQDQLKQNRQGTQHHRAQAPSLLAGLLYTEEGHKLIASHAVKKGKRYRYYIEQSPDDETSNHKPLARYAATEVEAAVLAALAAWLREPTELAVAVGLKILSPETMNGLTEKAMRLAMVLEQTETAHERLRSLLVSGRLGETYLTLTLRTAAIAEALGQPSPDTQATHEITRSCRVTRRGQQLKLILSPANGETGNSNIDTHLLETVARARRWYHMLRDGSVPSIRALARQENLSPAHVSRCLRLTFLSPAILRHIINGTQPPELTVEHLTRGIDLPLSWTEQEAQLLGYQPPEC